MSYTMTFDASHKVGRGGHAKAFFRHIARDVDRKKGFNFPQANPNVDPERTVFNYTMVNDGQGGVRHPKSVDGRPPSDEFDDYLKLRLSTVTRPLRKDAVLMRGIILQLDPKWFAEHNADWREEGLNKEALSYMGASLSWAAREFGARNIVGFSVHLDELHPQLQLAICPVTEDGRLSQKDFFKGPADLKRQHAELREAVAVAGYDVEYRVTERSREHLSSSEFQRKADWLRDAASEMESGRRDLETMRRSMRSRASELEGRRAEAERKEKDLAERRAAVELAALEANDARVRAQQGHRAAERARKDAEAERERLRDLSRRLEQLPPDVDRWLDKRMIGQRPLRELFNADMAKTRARRRDLIERIEPDATFSPRGGVDRER